MLPIKVVSPACSGTDTARSLAVDSANNVYVVGDAGNTLQASLTTLMGSKPGAATTGVYLVKYSPTGTPLWGRWIDGTGAETGNSVVVDFTGAVYIAGTAGTVDLQTALATIMGGAKPWTTSAGAFLIKYG